MWRLFHQKGALRQGNPFCFIYVYMFLYGNRHQFCLKTFILNFNANRIEFVCQFGFSDAFLPIKNKCHFFAYASIFFLLHLLLFLHFKLLIFIYWFLPSYSKHLILLSTLFCMLVLLFLPYFTIFSIYFFVHRTKD